jgi:hypothetical protein
MAVAIEAVEDRPAEPEIGATSGSARDADLVAAAIRGDRRGHRSWARS